MSNPFARLFGSLANVVLDLGLPTIRGWLRDRLGPEADVAEVKTDGSIVTLEGVRIPLGPRGLIVLDRAAATITSLGDNGPALRLHSFEGVLVFTKPELRDGFARTDDANAFVANATFRADIAFAAGDDPDPAAWIWGDIEIKRAIWSTGADVPPGPLKGAARIFVSSQNWRIDGGRLDGEASTGTDDKPPVVARFAAGGSLEPQPASTTVVPSSIATLALVVEHGRIGPFLDAMTALAGEAAMRTQIPAAIPRDTRLDGELSWSATDGARAEVRLDASTIGAHATVRAGFAPNGDQLTARMDATVAVAALVRRLEVPTAAIPRAEDVVAIVTTVTGKLTAPEAQIDVSALELGFRLGRPRFVPAVVLRSARGSVFIKEGRAVGQITAKVRQSDVAVDLESNLRDAGSTRVAVRVESLAAPVLRDLAATFALKLAIADDVAASVALTFGGAAWQGTVGLTTAGSRLVAQIDASPTAKTFARITGGFRAEDVVRLGVFAGAAVYPSRGDLVVAVDVDGDLRARGSLAAATTLELKVALPDMLPYTVAGAHVDLTLDRDGLCYEGLRFTAYGGRFAGYGSVPFSKPAPNASPYLVLQLEEGGLPLAGALFLLLPRPRPEIGFPRSLSASGQLVLATDLALAIDLVLGTTAGTNLALAVRSKKGNLDGSTAKGTLALEDALQIADSKLPLGGLLGVDLDVTDGKARTLRAVVSAARVEHAALAVDDLTVEMVVAPSGDVLWNRATGRLADGRISSFGVVQRSGDVLARLSAASVAVHELPPIEGRAPSKYVRGRASGSFVGRLANGGTLDARGDIVLDEASFPAIDRVRPALERYGLRPPNEDATGPAVATITIDAEGTHVTDVAVDLHGATVRAKVDVRPNKVLDGRVEIVLEEEYLRTSKLLTLPRVFGDRLVLPIAIRGTTEKPDVHAELGQTLGTFLRDNKVVDFVTSAALEAQLFFTSEKKRVQNEAPAVPVPTPSMAPTWESELRAAIDAHAADWLALAARRQS